MNTRRPASPPVLRLRGTTAPVLALIVRSSNRGKLESELARRVQAAGEGLAGEMGVFDLTHLTPVELAEVSLRSLCGMARRFGLHPIAVIGANEAQCGDAKNLGLTVLPVSAAGPAEDRDIVLSSVAAPEAPPPAPAAVPAPVELEAPCAPSGALILDKPVRSGQRVYARGRDLVVLAGTNPGSELIADGNIHCYGPLRGRAVAGAQGDTSARVFALDFQAEIVSIAGVYRSFDDPRDAWRGRAIKAWLKPQGDEHQLVMEPLQGS